MNLQLEVHLKIKLETYFQISLKDLQVEVVVAVVSKKSKYLSAAAG